MELEELRTVYQRKEQNKSMDSLKGMGRAGRHPVLKKIRLQLIIESVVWAIVLAAYYTGFDGDRKPWYMNALLVGCIAVLLVHNILGLDLARSPINGPDLYASLRRYADRIRRYARISIATRALAIVAILAFFASSVEWTDQKIITFTVFATVLVSLQVFLLSRIWKGRLRKIKKQVSSLEKDKIDG